jgi:hypothetical protein
MVKQVVLPLEAGELQYIYDVSARWTEHFECACINPDDEFTICFGETLVIIEIAGVKANMNKQ